MSSSDGSLATTEVSLVRIRLKGLDVEWIVDIGQHRHRQTDRQTDRQTHTHTLTRARARTRTHTHTHTCTLNAFMVLMALDTHGRRLNVKRLYLTCELTFISLSPSLLPPPLGLHPPPPPSPSAFLTTRRLKAQLPDVMGSAGREQRICPNKGAAIKTH